MAPAPNSPIGGYFKHAESHDRDIKRAVNSRRSIFEVRRLFFVVSNTFVYSCYICYVQYICFHAHVRQIG